MHKNIPKRVSQCHANHIFHHWMDWVQLWCLLAQCQSSLGITKSTMRNPVKPSSVRLSHKIKELKMASQFAKEDKATVFKFSYMITTVKYKASIGSWYEIPRCLKDLIEWGKKCYQKENWVSETWFKTDKKLNRKSVMRKTETLNQKIQILQTPLLKLGKKEVLEDLRLPLGLQIKPLGQRTRLRLHLCLNWARSPARTKSIPSN